MTATQKRERGKVLMAEHPTWPEARIVAWPEPGEKGGKGPRLLVERNVPDLHGPNGEFVQVLPGEPAISLFTGAGGMDLGLEQAGFCCVVQHEWWHEACQTLIANRPRYFRNAALIQGDIRDTPTSMLLSAGGLRVGEAKLVTGGPPCQGFSYSNTKRAKNADTDMRNTLVHDYVRVVREAQPDHFIFENVPGFQELGKGKFMEGFLRDCYDSYYEIVYGLTDAVEYGVPQYRCRFIAMGTRRDLVECDGILARHPRPQNMFPKDNHTIQTESGLFVAESLTSDEVDILCWPPGIRYFPDRPVLRTPPPVYRGDSEDHYSSAGRSKGFLDFYRKLLAEEPDRIPPPAE